MRGSIACGTCVVLAMAGCAEAPAPELTGPRFQTGGVQESVAGGGQFVHPDFGTVTFSFTAVRQADGGVSGRFQQNQRDLGLTYKGDVTCFAVDRVNHRAWIAGVLTHSNDPDPITEVGDDAWFRVLDTRDDTSEPDRSTFLGFEGGAGIITSEEYCAARLWAEGNARTWPVSGNLTIH